MAYACSFDISLKQDEELIASYVGACYEEFLIAGVKEAVLEAEDYKGKIYDALVWGVKDRLKTSDADMSRFYISCINQLISLGDD